MRSARPVQWDAPGRFVPTPRLEHQVELVNDVHKLAVLRANANGDYLVSLPALEALRAAYPHAELVLLGAGVSASPATGHRPGPGTGPRPPGESDDVIMTSGSAPTGYHAVRSSDSREVS